MLNELYQELCRHRVTHSDDYQPIHDVIHNFTKKYGYVQLIKNDEAGLLYKVNSHSESEPNTMFIAHMDMVNTAKSFLLKENAGDALVDTDLDINEINICRNIAGENMGADDKAGITVLLYMMGANVDGYYLFTRGEESGGIGAKAFISNKDNAELIANLSKVISFDRRGTHSIITEQGGTTCCSDKFALHLASIFRKHGMFHVPDPTGSYTCSKEFIYHVPECTNISVGYMREHTANETLDLGYLGKLIDACIEIDWQSLPVFKEPEVKPLPKVHPKYDSVYSNGYKPWWEEGYETPIRYYWDAQEGKYLPIPTVTELFPQVNADTATVTQSPKIVKKKVTKQEYLLHSMEFMMSETTLLINPHQATFDNILATLAVMSEMSVEEINGEVQYVVMTALQLEAILIGMPDLAKEIDERLAKIQDILYGMDALPIPSYVVITSPLASEDAITELEESECNQGGISPEQYGITEDKQYSIYSTSTTYYLY